MLHHDNNKLSQFQFYTINFISGGWDAVNANDLNAELPEELRDISSNECEIFLPQNKLKSFAES